MTDALKHREQILSDLCARRAAIAEDRANNPDASVHVSPWFVYTYRGFHHYVFPALPEELDIKTKSDVCRRWVESELVSKGMICDCTLFASGPIFSCTTREVKEDGFG